MGSNSAYAATMTQRRRTANLPNAANGPRMVFVVVVVVVVGIGATVADAPERASFLHAAHEAQGIAARWIPSTLENATLLASPCSASGTTPK